MSVDGSTKSARNECFSILPNTFAGTACPRARRRERQDPSRCRTTCLRLNLSPHYLADQCFYFERSRGPGSRRGFAQGQKSAIPESTLCAFLSYFFLVDHPLFRVRCPSFSLSLSLSRSLSLSPSGSLLLSLTGSGSLFLTRSHSLFLTLSLQGVIYPVSHRSLRIKFWALRTNCETQSKKVRIKKIICEAVQSMHRTQQLARSQSPARSAGNCCMLVPPRRSPAPVLNWRRVLLLDKAQFPDLSAHSFRDSSTGRSTWWDRVFALEDFLEMAVNLSTVSKWKKELDVLGEWLHYDEATVR